ncbi:MAG: HYR domain-containing protein, partial [Saprospiraceae bacterium]|nr:HYR domain-containing protein [Saprospiraceae bacterium]
MNKLLLYCCICLFSIGQVLATTSNSGKDIPKTDDELSNYEMEALGVDCTPNSVPFCASQETASIGQTSCVTVNALNFAELAAFQFTIEFDTAIIEYQEININVEALADLGIDDFNTDLAAEGVISCAYFTEIGFGTTLDDDTPIFEVCFQAKAEGTSEVNFTSSVTPIAVFNNELEEIPFTAGCGSVTVLPCDDVFTTIDTTICEGQSIFFGGTIYTTPGSYQDVLMTSLGCDSTITLNLMVDSINFMLPSIVEVCEGEQATISVPDTLSLGFPGGPFAQNIILNPGNYVLVVVDDETGCEEQQLVSVEELALPDVIIEGEFSYCAGESVELTATGAIEYEWSTGETTATIIVDSPGEYTVTGVDVNGCVAMATVIVEEFPLPEVEIIGELAFCQGDSTQLTASGAVSYVWSTGETTASIFVSSPGAYTVTGTDANGCTNIATVIVEENLLPSLDIIGPLSICAGSTTEITVVGAETYVWSTGETTTSIQINMPGDYSVTGTDANGCENSIDFTVTELPLPVVEISGELLYCAGTSTVLTATGAETYLWSTGETGPSITVNTPGVYSVIGTDNNGCENEAMVTVEELPLPTVEIDGAFAFCAGDETELTASGAETYVWSTGDQTPSIVVTAAGTYTVTGTDVNGCVNTAEVEVIELPLPVVGIDGNLSYCSGDETELTAFGAETYMWSTGSMEESIIVNMPGDYSVTGTDANGCMNVATVTVEELPLPDASIQGELTICEGDQTELFAAGGISYEWSTGEMTEMITVSVAGDYSVTVTDENGCQAVATITVEVLPLPDVQIEGDLSYCFGSETTLTAVGADTYAWSTGETTAEIIVSSPGIYSVTGTDANGCENVASVEVNELLLPEVEIIGDLAYCPGEFTTLEAIGALFYSWSTGETTPSITVTAPGEYSVTGTDANGCENIATVIVDEFPGPDAGIQGVLEYCVGTSTTLTAFGGVEYEWSTGETTTSIEVDAPGDYSVTVVDANGCVGEASAFVTELPLPDVGIDGILEICAGDETELTAFGADTYLWSTGETTPTIVVTLAGDYSVTGTDAFGCMNVATVTITESASPVVVITGDLNYCPNDPGMLTASGADTYTWSTGETTASIVPTGPGTYSVTGTDTNGCIGTATVEVMDDMEPPVFVFCPSDITVFLNAGIGEINVDWTEPLVEDNCGDPITITSDFNPGDGFALGVTTVTYTAVDAAGNEATCSFNVNVEATADLTFFVDTLDYTSSNDTFCVPVRVLDFEGVVGFQFTVTAPDANQSTIFALEAADDLAGGIDIDAFTFQEIAPNVYGVLWVDETGQGLSLPDSTVVFNIKMTISAPPGECVPLTLNGNPLSAEAFQLPQGGVVPTLFGGDICVRGFINIAGETYKINFEPIKDTEVTLDGPVLLTDLTDAAGRYEFQDQDSGEDYSIIPMRDFDDPEGLSVIDMVLILRHIRFLELITDPYLLIAADVNNTAGITISDV